MLPGMHQLEPLRLGGTGVVTTKEGGPPRRVEEPARLLEGRRHGVNIRILRNLKVPERVWANMGVSAPPPQGTSMATPLLGGKDSTRQVLMLHQGF